MNIFFEWVKLSELMVCKTQETVISWPIRCIKFLAKGCNIEDDKHLRSFVERSTLKALRCKPNPFTQLGTKKLVSTLYLCKKSSKLVSTVGNIFIRTLQRTNILVNETTIYVARTTTHLRSKGKWPITHKQLDLKKQITKWNSPEP